MKVMLSQKGPEKRVILSRKEVLQTREGASFGDGLLFEIKFIGLVFEMLRCPPFATGGCVSIIRQ